MSMQVQNRSCLFRYRVAFLQQRCVFCYGNT